MLEELKAMQMELAQLKGWGTAKDIDTINVPQKIALIGNEIHEAQEAIEKFHDHWFNSYDYWSELSEKDLSYSFMASRVGILKNWRAYGSELDSSLKDLIEEYKMECSDVLQRTLHLGGIYNITFPDVEDYNQKLVHSRINTDDVSSVEADFAELMPQYLETKDISLLYQFNQRFLLRQLKMSQDVEVPGNNDLENLRYGLKLYDRVLTCHRKKDMCGFEENLIALAHFSVLLASYDGYDISDYFKRKVRSNRDRDWDATQFNEKFL